MPTIHILPEPSPAAQLLPNQFPLVGHLPRAFVECSVNGIAEDRSPEAERDRELALRGPQALFDGLKERAEGDVYLYQHVSGDLARHGAYFLVEGFFACPGDADVFLELAHRIWHGARYVRIVRK